MANKDPLKEALRTGKVQAYEVGMMISGTWQESLNTIALINDISVGRGIECDKRLVVQWATVFVQAWYKEQTLKETLTSYEYPDGLPNLTKDQTSDWTVNNTKTSMQHNTYGDEVALHWLATELGEEMRFSTRHVLLPNQTILKFD